MYVEPYSHVEAWCSLRDGGAVIHWFLFLHILRIVVSHHLPRCLQSILHCMFWSISLPMIWLSFVSLSTE